jgi:pimeloyl-ACP methyl ester carboxylesterase
MLQRRHHQAHTSDGWVLSMRQVLDPQRLDAGRAPILIVPGYGMNSSIFAYHPSGPSLEECLAAAGFEVWCVDLRGQGESFSLQQIRPYGLADMARLDVRSAIRTVCERSFSSTKAGVHAIGCSLGATLLYTHLAHPGPERLASIVSIGGPMRWVEVHPLLKRLFVSPRLAGFVPVRGTRRTVRLLLPLLLRFPKLLSMYLHPDLIDTSDVGRLVQSVEDPSPQLNREIAEWIQSGELRVDGRTLSDVLRSLDLPLLCVAANADGIVPPASVFSALQAIGSARRDQIVVGTAQRNFAHADLFVSRYSQELVFEPVARWLAGLGPADTAHPGPPSLAPERAAA